MWYDCNQIVARQMPERIQGILYNQSNFIQDGLLVETYTTLRAPTPFLFLLALYKLVRDDWSNARNTLANCMKSRSSGDRSSGGRACKIDINIGICGTSKDAEILTWYSSHVRSMTISQWVVGKTPAIRSLPLCHRVLQGTHIIVSQTGHVASGSFSSCSCTRAEHCGLGQ